MSDSRSNLRQVRHIDVSLEHGAGSVGLEVDPGQVHLGAVELEVGRHVHPHRLVVANPDIPLGAGRVPPIVEHLGDGEIEVRAEDAIARTMVIQDELAAVRA